MLKRLLLAAGLLLAGGSGPLLAADPPAAAKAADPSSASVRVGYRVGAVQAWGTGTVLACEGGKSLVLTNRHVCPDAKGKATVVKDGWEYPAAFVAADAAADLALVETEWELPAAAGIAAAEPAPGTRLTMWGYGGNWAPTRKAGPLGPVRGRRVDDGSEVGQAGVVSVDGDSGSGLFDAAGRLVAVVWGGDGRTAATVPLAYVRSFVRGKCGGQYPELAKAIGDAPPPAKAAVPACRNGKCPYQR
jgi:hypothetical protein